MNTGSTATGLVALVADLYGGHPYGSINGVLDCCSHWRVPPRRSAAAFYGGVQSSTPLLFIAVLLFCGARRAVLLVHEHAAVMQDGDGRNQ